MIPFDRGMADHDHLDDCRFSRHNGTMRWMLRFVIPVLACAAPALGWGADGHHIVADLAAQRLSPRTLRQVQAILGQQTLADAATWADDVRRDPAYHWSAPLHYVNIPKGQAGFNAGRDCRDGRCVVGAIERYQGVLRNPVSTPPQRLEALRFLIHFVGDIHQPLHASYAEDKGGNDVKVEFFGNRTNLHTVWDTMILRRARRGMSWRQYSAQLSAKITPEAATGWASETNPARWADESYRLAVSNGYDIPKDGRIEQAYYDRNLPVVNERLQAAGVRLAAMLNAVFAPTTAPSASTTPAPAGAPSTQPATSAAERPPAQ